MTGIDEGAGLRSNSLVRSIDEAYFADSLDSDRTRRRHRFWRGLSGPAKDLGLLGTVFLRLIKSIIAPLLFGTLVCGIAGTGSAKTMGRIGGKAILYFEIVTTIALFVGLGFANFIKPGVGVQLKGSAPGWRRRIPVSRRFWNTLSPPALSMSMADGEVLQIVVFAFLFGTACATSGGRPSRW